MLWYSLVDMTWYMVILGDHGIWYGLSGMAWSILWLDVHGMVYGIAWRAWHGVWYVLGGMALYMYMELPGVEWYIRMVWPGGTTCIYYGLVDMALYMV